MPFFKIADFLVDIQLDRSQAHLLSYEAYAPFITQQPQGELLFTASFSPLHIHPEASHCLGIFDTGVGKNEVYRDDEGYQFVIYGLDEEVCCMLKANNRFSSATLDLRGTQEQQAFGLNNALMLLFAFAGAYRDTLLMHASVTMKDGKGYLFLGKSGTGKSTHSKMWLQHIPGTTLLNDDNPAVRLYQGIARVYGTPWSGKTSCYKSESVPCGAFVRIQQHPENVIQRHGAPAAFASVLSSCSTMIWDKPSHQAIANTVASILCTVPSYLLACRPEGDAAKICYATLTQTER